MRILLLFALLTSLIALNSCKTVDTKIQETLKIEDQRLSAFIGKNQSYVRIDLGNPTEEIVNEQGFITLIYRSKKYGFKCVRTFTVDKTNMISGFESKGCF
tara:strand:- start:395 stop:697 length:303 start_codon:yes stop_codon:yes gene_type:complete